MVYVSSTVLSSVRYTQSIKNLESLFHPLTQFNGGCNTCFLHTYSTESLSGWAVCYSSNKDKEARRDRQLNNMLE